jgi:hypothetical protein
MICSDPLLLNEPSQTWVSEAALDVFNPFIAHNSFYPTSGSPLLGAGTTGGASVDYYGVASSNLIGAVNYVSLTTPSYSGPYIFGTP